MALCMEATLAPCHKDHVSETPKVTGGSLGWQSCATDRQGWLCHPGATRTHSSVLWQVWAALSASALWDRPCCQHS